jgi:hypothetical protein
VGEIKRRSWDLWGTGKVEQLTHRIHTPAFLGTDLGQRCLHCRDLVGQAQFQEPSKLPIAVGALSDQFQACRLKGSGQIPWRKAEAQGTANDFLSSSGR